MKNSPSSTTERAEAKALARYAAVSWVKAHLQAGEKCRIAVIRRAADMNWDGRHFAASTLERYFYRYQRQGFAALQTRVRADRGQLKALSLEARERLLALRLAHPQLGVPTLIRQLVEEQVLTAGAFSYSSIYRLLEREGLDRRTLRAKGGVIAGPTKAFELPLANALWMTDLMYGPTLRLSDGKTVQTRLFALLDDCSRLCPHAQYYASESVDCFLDVLRVGVSRRGIPERLYTDHGAVFTCKHLRVVCANLDIRLLHAKPYAAWSKGKIERYFRTVQGSFQQTLVLQPVNSLEELNARFWQWLESEYHQRIHDGIGQTPAERFAQRSATLRLAPAAEQLERLFLHQEQRRVRKDATISLGGKWWEVPPILRGQRVDLHFDPFAYQSILIYWRGQYYGEAKPLNKNLNASDFRSNNYESPNPRP